MFQDYGQVQLVAATCAGVGHENMKPRSPKGTISERDVKAGQDRYLRL